MGRKKREISGVWAICHACKAKFWATGDKRRRYLKGRPCGCGNLDCTNAIKREIGKKKKGRSTEKVNVVPTKVKIAPWIPYSGVGSSNFPALHNPF